MCIRDSCSSEDGRILRQSLAGMIWSKQFFHFDVARWQDGDQLPPPAKRKLGRNRTWRHMKAADIISMPDKWEYPWFAAWDLAFHCAALALVDVDFAKGQIELLLKRTTTRTWRSSATSSSWPSPTRSPVTARRV